MPPGNGHQLQAADVDDTYYDWQAIPTDYSKLKARGKKRKKSRKGKKERKKPRVHINDLPDNLLVHVLQHVPPRELLSSIRAVCRRWREVALQFDLWMHCSMKVPKLDDVETACRVMRIAPCLYHLHLDYTEETKTVLALACNTVCSIYSLHMNIQKDLPLDPVLWSLVNQAEDTRCLSLAFYSVNVNYVAAILRAVADMGLIELDLFCLSPVPRDEQFLDDLPLDDLHGVVQENLKFLDIWVPWQVPLTEHLLGFFAPGVESVVLRSRVSPVAFYALGHCTKVTTLSIYPWWRRSQSGLLDAGDSEALEHYFRSSTAANLKNLRFEDRNAWNLPPFPDFEIHKLISYLSLSGSSQLETLHLCGMVIHYFNIEKLGPAIARLPNLTHLETNVPLDPTVQAALSSYFPPRLKNITVAPCSFSFDKMSQINGLVGFDKTKIFVG